MKTFPDQTVCAFNEGNSVFVIDDHCYVLKNWTGKSWGPSAWIFKAAANILRELPTDPDDAKNQMEMVKFKLVKIP